MPTTHFGTITEHDQRKGLVFALPDDRSVTNGRRILLPIGSFRLPGPVKDTEPQFIYPSVLQEPSLDLTNKRAHVAFQLISPEPAKGPRASNWSYRHSWERAYSEMRSNIMLRVPTGHGEARAWGWEYLGQFAWDEPHYRNPEYRTWRLPFDNDGNRTPGGFVDYWYLPLWRVPITSDSVEDVMVIRNQMRFLFGGLTPEGYVLQPPSSWTRHQVRTDHKMDTYFINGFGFDRVLITEMVGGEPFITISDLYDHVHICSEGCQDPARWIQEN